MKICWDNLEKLHYNPISGWWLKNRGSGVYEYREECLICHEPYLARRGNNVSKQASKFCSYDCSKIGKKKVWLNNGGEAHPWFGRKHTEEEKKKIGKGNKGKTAGEKSSKWKGGVSAKNLPLYDTHVSKIDWCEVVRRDPEDTSLLQVKCTYCGKWFTPTCRAVKLRYRASIGKEEGEGRLYCSDKCKRLCPIFGRTSTYKYQEGDYSREVQPELRQMVFERDNWTCRKCGRTEGLECHHIEGLRWDPIESADVDKCITYCVKCHRKVHKIEGCRYSDMQCTAYDQYGLI